MLTNFAELGIRIVSNDIDKTNRGLDTLIDKGGVAERATDGLGNAFKRLAGPLLAAVGAMQTVGKLVDVQRQFDVLSAGLQTATGSAENAQAAFAALQEFAATTPYSLDQAVEGFTKLVNLGLTPSEQALRSYGNTASAMGKDLSQMVEAVADATVGEFERLKEFGIKAKQQGDQVALTFRGTTTTIGNSAAEIERYLIGLGENEFAGAMERRMDSLDGALSNLADSWNQLFLNVSQNGVGDAIEDGVRLAIAALDELNAMFASGEMEEYLRALSTAFGDFGTEAIAALQNVGSVVSELFRNTSAEGKTAGQVVFETLTVLGANTLYVLKGIGYEITGITAQLAALARGDFDGFARIGREMEAHAVKARKEIDALTESILNPKTPATGGTAAAYQQHIEEARRLRAEWEKTRDARQQATEDRLARFKVSGDDRASAGNDRTTAAATRQRQNELASLVASLRTEEEAIAASYAKRKAIIEANTSADSAARAELMGRLDQQRDQQLAKLQESRGRDLEQLRQSLLTEEEATRESYERRLQIIQDNTAAGSTQRADMTARLQQEYEQQQRQIEDAKQRERDNLFNGLLSEEEMLRQSYERRKQAILDSTAVTETERLDLLQRLEQQYTNEMAAAEQKRTSTQLASAAAMFDGLAGIAKSYGGEQSKAYRTLFAISKAFSVAQATMSIATGIARAQELGFPANLGEIARVVATGASVMSSIKGANFAGAYDQGGQIPAGKIGIVGEYGPELVQGPAKVTGRRRTADEIANMATRGAPGQPQDAGQDGGNLTLVIQNDVLVQNGNQPPQPDHGLGSVMDDISKKVQADILQNIRDNGIWARVIG